MRHLILLCCLLIMGCKSGSTDSAPDGGSSPSARTSASGGSGSDFFGPIGDSLAFQGNDIYAIHAERNCAGELASTKWIVMKSTNEGASWSRSDYLVSRRTEPQDIYITSAGTIMTAGLGTSNWWFRTSTDGGETWRSTDSNSDSENFSDVIGTATAIAEDSSSNLYAAGRVDNGNQNPRWLVRKSSDGGAIWTTMDDYSISNGPIYEGPTDIVIDSSDNIFVAGEIYNNSSQTYEWLVRKSSDGGNSWANVDLLTANCYAHRMTKNASDHLFVVGACIDSETGYHWIVRKSTDSGSTWVNIDDYHPTSGAHALAFGIGVNSSGHLYVAGQVFEAPYYVWKTRKSTDGGATWATVDTYRGDDYVAQRSRAYNLTIDGSDNVYVSGLLRNSTNSGDHWVIRKSTNGGGTWSTSLTYNYDLLNAPE